MPALGDPTHKTRGINRYDAIRSGVLFKSRRGQAWLHKDKKECQEQLPDDPAQISPQYDTRVNFLLLPALRISFVHCRYKVTIEPRCQGLGTK
jgi:hypothetical protein